MPKTFLSNEEIRREGLRAVRDRLGAEGLVRFLQQFDSGSGDYTKDRYKWLPDGDLEEVAALVEKTAIKAKKPTSSRPRKKAV